jgi:PhnB protein
MARTSIYLNFERTTEEAFRFYQSIFGGEFTRGGIARMGDVPQQEGQPALSDADKQLVMHVELPILGGLVLMGTDSPQSMGFTLVQGNSVHINLEPDTREEAEQLFLRLSEGGKVEMPLQDMFWGAYFGSLRDKFGVQWMVNCESRVPESDEVIIIQTVVHHTIETVWNAWTDPVHITQWNHARDDWECPEAHNDLRVGGILSATMRAKDGSASFDFQGTYTNVVPHSALAFTFSDGRKVSVTFVEKTDGVHIVEMFEMEHENPRDMQEKGWQAILDNFAAYTEGLTRT